MTFLFCHWYRLIALNFVSPSSTYWKKFLYPNLIHSKALFEGLTRTLIDKDLLKFDDNY